MKTQYRMSTLALAVAAFAMACADPGTGPGRTLLSDGVVHQVTQVFYPGPQGPSGINSGDVELCKTANAAGTFTFSVTVNGNETAANESITLPGGGGTQCIVAYHSLLSGSGAPDVVVITEGADLDANWDLTAINTQQFLAQVMFNKGGYLPPSLDDAESLANRQATLYINGDMARRVTFTNTHTLPPPPPPVCDFITFGRLVIEANGQRVVISGNAGGNNANGTIKNEFHIVANGVDNHVADAFSYGPITSGPLFGLTNSRIVTGTAKNGVAVELRLWDGGEPGKNTDRVYVKLNGVELLGPNGALINQGNMQYHNTCRGPG